MSSAFWPSSAATRACSSSIFSCTRRPRRIERTRPRPSADPGHERAAATFARLLPLAEAPLRLLVALGVQLLERFAGGRRRRGGLGAAGLAAAAAGVARVQARAPAAAAGAARVAAAAAARGAEAARAAGKAVVERRAERNVRQCGAPGHGPRAAAAHGALGGHGHGHRRAAADQAICGQQPVARVAQVGAGRLRERGVGARLARPAQEGPEQVVRQAARLGRRARHRRLRSKGRGGGRPGAAGAEVPRDSAIACKAT